MIRILIAEDEAMVLGALSALLEIESDFEVVAQARSGAEALGLAVRQEPDIVVTDIEMPGMSGLELSAEIARQLKLSEGTMRNYLLETIGKIGARNRTEAARLARQKGWL